jgi:hypothetical protein
MSIDEHMFTSSFQDVDRDKGPKGQTDDSELRLPDPTHSFALR